MRFKDDLEKLEGKTITAVEGMTKGSAKVRLVFDGGFLEMFHEQDCCEEVYLDDVVGDPEDLVGSPIQSAYCESSSLGVPPKTGDDSYTWTFYRLRTYKGGPVVLRWYGSSNGYYSEEITTRLTRTA